MRHEQKCEVMQVYSHGVRPALGCVEKDLFELDRSGAKIITTESAIFSEGSNECQIQNDAIQRPGDASAGPITRLLFRPPKNARIATSKNCSIGRARTAATTTVV